MTRYTGHFKVGSHWLPSLLLLRTIYSVAHWTMATVPLRTIYSIAHWTVTIVPLVLVFALLSTFWISVGSVAGHGVLLLSCRMSTCSADSFPCCEEMFTFHGLSTDLWGWMLGPRGSVQRDLAFCSVSSDIPSVSLQVQYFPCYVKAAVPPQVDFLYSVNNINLIASFLRRIVNLASNICWVRYLSPWHVFGTLS